MTCSYHLKQDVTKVGKISNKGNENKGTEREQKKRRNRRQTKK